MKRRKFISMVGTGIAGAALPATVWAKEKQKCNEAVCRAAWEELCRNAGSGAGNGAFNYVHPVEGLPNVLIYGDSISIAYTPQVRAQLKGKATVFRLFKNGESSHHFIPNMEMMKKTMFQPYLKEGWYFSWDLIHFNVGLHDLKYLYNGKLDNEKGKQVSSIEIYKENLERICRYLKTNYPKAKLIFATTTAVPEGAQGRYAGDSVRYNKAAFEVLAAHPEIVINDLYGFTLPHQKEWALRQGNVHYNKAGFSAQGKEVARVIAENL